MQSTSAKITSFRATRITKTAQEIITAALGESIDKTKITMTVEVELYPRFVDQYNFSEITNCVSAEIKHEFEKQGILSDDKKNIGQMFGGV